MIYFLINNNYQYIDFRTHKEQFSANEIALIEIPHTLEKHEKELEHLIFRYEVAHFDGICSQIIYYFLTIGKINRDIRISNNDVLFFYTEYEILNQYVVRKFKEAGAHVYLIEDGGLGTYVPYRRTDCERLTVKEWVRGAIYRCLPGLSRIRFLKLNGFIFYQVSDDYIDAVLLYNSVKIRRNIRTILISRNVIRLNFTEYGRVIFLNEPLYDIYQSNGEYIAGLKYLLKGLCAGYKEVYFKFHPREKSEWRELIRGEISTLQLDIRIVEEDIPIEALVERYVPAAAASYFCSALLTLADRGIEPVYLYHLVSDLKNQPVFLETSLILQELGYLFATEISEIGSSYKSGIVENACKPESIGLGELVTIQSTS